MDGVPTIPVDWFQTIAGFSPGPQRADQNSVEFANELLFSLLGVEGRFVSISDGKFVAFSASTDVRRILEVSSKYLEILRFIDGCRSYFRGVINQRLAHSLETNFVPQHNSAVSDMFSRISTGQTVESPVEAISAHLGEVSGIVSSISSLVRQVENGGDPLTGGTVINIVKEELDNSYGDSLLRAILERILGDLTEEYFKLLTAWVLLGRHPGNNPRDFFVFFLHKAATGVAEYRIEWKIHPRIPHVPYFLRGLEKRIMEIGLYRGGISYFDQTYTEKYYFQSLPGVSGLALALDQMHGELSMELYSRFDRSSALNLVRVLNLLGRFYLFRDREWIEYEGDLQRDYIRKHFLEPLRGQIYDAPNDGAGFIEEILSLSPHKSAPKGGISKVAHIAKSTNTMRNIVPSEMYFRFKYPTSLVFGRKILSKYQLIFRFLYRLESVKGQLLETIRSLKYCSRIKIGTKKAAFSPWMVARDYYVLISGLGVHFSDTVIALHLEKFSFDASSPTLSSFRKHVRQRLIDPIFNEVFLLDSKPWTPSAPTVLLLQILDSAEGFCRLSSELISAAESIASGFSTTKGGVYSITNRMRIKTRLQEKVLSGALHNDGFSEKLEDNRQVLVGLCRKLLHSLEDGRGNEPLDSLRVVVERLCGPLVRKT